MIIEMIGLSTVWTTIVDVSSSHIPLHCSNHLRSSHLLVSLGAHQACRFGEDQPQVHRYHLEVWPRKVPDDPGEEGLHGKCCVPLGVCLVWVVVRCRPPPFDDECRRVLSLWGKNITTAFLLILFGFLPKKDEVENDEDNNQTELTLPSVIMFLMFFFLLPTGSTQEGSRCGRDEGLETFMSPLFTIFFVKTMNILLVRYCVCLQLVLGREGAECKLFGIFHYFCI